MYFWGVLPLRTATGYLHTPVLVECPCGIRCQVRLWPLYCSCGRVYGCGGAELEMRRGKPVIPKGLPPCGCRGQQPAPDPGPARDDAQRQP